MRRLEQVTALVVAAGLAVISYWLFFSWAGGGGVRDVSSIFIWISMCFLLLYCFKVVLN